MGNGGTGTTQQKQVLLGLYQIERSETASILGHALQLVGVAVAYLVAAVAVATSVSSPLPSWVLVLLPLPTWFAAAFHLILNALVHARGASISVLESALLDEGQFLGDRRLAIGSAAGRSVTHLPLTINRERWTLAFATLLAYGGAGLVVITFTVLSLIAAYQEGARWLSIFGGAGYFTATVIIGIGWRQILTISVEDIISWVRKDLNLGQQAAPAEPNAASAASSRFPVTAND